MRFDPPVLPIFEAHVPGEGDFGPRQVLAFDKRRIVSGTETIRFVTAVKPKFAGVDPYNELIDRNSDDNVIAVR